MPYTKTPHFDVAREVSGRDASLAAYMLPIPLPGNTIEFKNRAREIPDNTETDFEWREFPVSISSGVVTIDFPGELGGDNPIVEGDLSIFGADRDYNFLTFPRTYQTGDLHMTISDFTFAAPAGGPFTLRNVILRNLKNTKYSWTLGSRPMMYYDLYISEVVTDIPSISGSDDTIYPYVGGGSSNTPTLISQNNIVIDGSQPSSDTYRLNIPVAPYTLTAGTEYALHFVPVGLAGALGMDLKITINRDDTPAATGLVTNSVKMEVREGADPTGVLINPQVGTGQQTSYYPDILLLTGTEGTHYIQYDINGEELDIVEDDELDTNQVIIAGEANRTQGGVAIPLPFVYQLKYDNYAQIGKVSPESTVNFSSDDGRTIPELQYKVISDSSLSREDNIDAYVSKIFMAEELAEASVLTKAKYTRILDGELQVNYKDIVDPRPLAKYYDDYTFAFALGNKLIVLNSGGSLGSIGDASSVWVKKAKLNAINALPPIGRPRGAWKPRISLGSFTRYQVKTDFGVKDIDYIIPDITGYPVAINWAAGYGNPAASGNPYLSKATRESIYTIDPYTLQLPRQNVYFWDGNWASGYTGGTWEEGVDSYPNYVVPNILDPNVVYGDSTEAQWSHGINIYLNRDTLMDNTNIYGWNKRNGVLKLRRPVTEEEVLTATYLYEQKEVEIDVDMNPILGHPNSDRVGDTVRVVLKPNWDTYAPDTGDPDAAGGVYVKRLAWHWLSENDTGEYIYDFAASSGTMGYSFIDGSGIGLPEHTVILGDYSIGQSTPFESNLIDTRIRGGGIKTDEWFTSRRRMSNLSFAVSPKARRIVNRESEYYWDIGHMDGEPYQADGSLIISIPSTTKDTIETRIIDDTAGTTNVTPVDKDMIDGVFAGSGNYDLEVILNGIDDPSRQNAIKQYVALREGAAEMAIEEIRAKIDKHVALGEFYILVDETGNTLDDANTVSNAVSRQKDRRKTGANTIAGVVVTAGDPSREKSTSIRESFPDTVNKNKARGL